MDVARWLLVWGAPSEARSWVEQYSNSNYCAVCRVVEGHLGGAVDRVMIHLLCVSYLCPDGDLDGTALTSASSGFEKMRWGI